MYSLQSETVTSISPVLSLDSTSIPRYSPKKGLKAERGAQTKCGQEKAGNIQTQGRIHTHATKIDIVPDDVLLEIFASIKSSRTLCEIRKHPVWEWHRLVHVCRRWRQLIFASPLRLDLQLLCTYGTPISKSLGCWPPLPLVVDYSYHPDFGDCPGPLSADELENILAALAQRDRVRHVDLSVWYRDLENLIAVMEEPFPALTYLRLASEYMYLDLDAGFPGEFLGGSTPPLLREITLSGILLPELPPLISSASGLVKLRLHEINMTPIISPQAMIACLATLTRLECLSLEFRPTFTLPGQTSLPPETRRLALPALTSFLYTGQNTYLNAFVAQVNTPRLNSIDTEFLCGDLVLHVTELSRFIVYSNLRPSRLGHAKIYVKDDEVSFKFYPKIDLVPTVAMRMRSMAGGEYAQVMDMALLLRKIPAILTDVVNLEIEADGPEEGKDKALDNIRWLDLFHPFPAVETLRVSSRFAKSVAEGITAGMATDTQVLPALNSVSLEGVQPRTTEELCAAFLARDRPLATISFGRLNSGIVTRA